MFELFLGIACGVSPRMYLTDENLRWLEEFGEPGEADYISKVIEEKIEVDDEEYKRTVDRIHEANAEARDAGYYDKGEYDED